MAGPPKKAGAIKIVNGADGQILLFINDRFVKTPPNSWYCCAISTRELGASFPMTCWLSSLVISLHPRRACTYCDSMS